MSIPKTPKKRYFVVEVDAEKVNKVANRDKWDARISIQLNSTSDNYAWSTVYGVSQCVDSFNVVEDDKELAEWILKKKALAKLSV